MRSNFWLVSLLVGCQLAVAAGCGGQRAGSASGGRGADAGDAGEPAGDGPSGDGPSGDGGCVAPEEGAGCDGSTACQPADPCCAGYAWVCSGISGTWMKSTLTCPCDAGAGQDGGAAPGPFACGDASCPAGSFCEDHPASEPNDPNYPDTFTCSAAPASCAGVPDCPCVVALPPAESCSPTSCVADDAGHVTVQCLWY